MTGLAHERRPAPHVLFHVGEGLSRLSLRSVGLTPNSEVEQKSPPMTQAEKFSKFADTGAVRQNLKRKSVRGVLFMVSSAGIDFIIRLSSTFLLARLLSPTDFGLVAMVISVTAIAEQISELGLSTATIQCRELSHQQVTNLFWINFAAGCLLSLLICGLAPGIASFYRNPVLVPMTLAISTTFIWGGLTVQHQALLSRQMKQAHLAIIRLSASFLSLIVAIVLAINHFGVWALAWREVTRAFFVAAGMWLFCRWIPGWPRRNADIRDLLRYGSHLTLNQLAVACLTQLDRLLMGRFFGASPLGLYRQAQQLILAPVDHLNAPIYSVASPSLSILQVDAARYRRYYQRIVLVISLATMPFGLFVAIFAQEITHVLLGPQWTAATVFLQIFGLVAFLKPAVDTVLVVMLTYGLSKRMLVLSVIYYTLSAAFMFAGIYWGAVGIALSNVVTIVVLMFPKLYFSLRRTPVTVGAFFSAISTPAIASVVMAGGLLLFRGIISRYGMAVSLFSSFGLAAVLYTAVLFLLPRGRREIIALISALVTSFQRSRQPVLAFDEANTPGVL
jgi:O-antigen/teichoic acid export membrane protein